MIKYNLKCQNDHEFSWFSNSEEFDKLNKKGLLECIFCSSKKLKINYSYRWNSKGDDKTIKTQK